LKLGFARYIFWMCGKKKLIIKDFPVVGKVFMFLLPGNFKTNIQ